MAAKKFSKKEALRFGWVVFRENAGFFIGMFLIAVAIYYTPAIIAQILKQKMPLLSLLFSIIAAVLNIIIQMGIVKVSLKLCDKEPVSFSDIFSSYRLFFIFLLATVIYNLIILAGGILLIIPGVIWAIMFQYYSYLIIDKRAGPIESLKESARITRGAKGDLFLFILLVVGINLLGALLLLVGLFVSVPVSIMATAFVYRRLLAQAPAVSASST